MGPNRALPVAPPHSHRIPSKGDYQQGFSNYLVHFVVADTDSRDAHRIEGLPKKVSSQLAGRQPIQVPLLSAEGIRLLPNDQDLHLAFCRFDTDESKWYPREFLDGKPMESDHLAQLWDGWVPAGHRVVNHLNVSYAVSGTVSRLKKESILKEMKTALTREIKDIKTKDGTATMSKGPDLHFVVRCKAFPVNPRDLCGKQSLKIVSGILGDGWEIDADSQGKPLKDRMRSIQEVHWPKTGGPK